jgi:hypothetical protein
MKNLVLLFISFCSLFSFAQQGPVAAGTSTTGAGGSVSYSIGQIDHIAPTGSGGNTNEGLQQPYELFVVSTSLNEKDKTISINVFPNPASHSVIIELKNTDLKDCHYQLADVNGKLITWSVIKERSTTIDVSELSSGIYYISIYNNSSGINSYKLIKH